MNQLDRVFKSLRKKKKKALIVYVTAGYPRFSEQDKLIAKMAEKGVDILEIGVPFSDPIADGPTIQFSSQESLKRGTHLKSILLWAKRLYPKVQIPFVVMSYLNPLLSYGLENFARDARRSGISGVIIPDLIPEEAKNIQNDIKEKRGLSYLPCCSHHTLKTAAPDRS